MTVDVPSTVQGIYDEVLRRNRGEKEFHQAVREVLDSLAVVLERHREFSQMKTVERICEPERQIIFRVPWVDDAGNVQISDVMAATSKANLGMSIVNEIRARGLEAYQSIINAQV